MSKTLKNKKSTFRGILFKKTTNQKLKKLFSTLAYQDISQKVINWRNQIPWNDRFSDNDRTLDFGTHQKVKVKEVHLYSALSRETHV